MSTPRRRRPRYPGTHPRRFEEKYKERSPDRYPEEVRKALDRGGTPAGAHRPVMVGEVLAVLAPAAGEVAVDATLGHGGHARALLDRLSPGGRLIGVDRDAAEIGRATERLRAAGFGPDRFSAHRTNFAGLAGVLAAEGLSGVDLLLADLGASSMQLDDPARGFSFKTEGPLDMRMSPGRGRTARELLASTAAGDLAALLAENADEPRAERLAAALAGRDLGTTTALARAVRDALPRLAGEERELAVRRVFQALRIAVNDEFGALDALLRGLPAILRPGGRAAILTFHSGEDRRVKRAFEAGLAARDYAEISPSPLRPTPEERRANPRAAAAKLRWVKHE